MRKVMIGGLKGYERKLALSQDTFNPKWKPYTKVQTTMLQEEERKRCWQKPIGLRKGKTKSRRMEDLQRRGGGWTLLNTTTSKDTISSRMESPVIPMTRRPVGMALSKELGQAGTALMMALSK